MEKPCGLTTVRHFASPSPYRCPPRGDAGWRSRNLLLRLAAAVIACALTLSAIQADGTIGGKNVVAERIPKPEDARHCRILFISSSEDSRLKQVFAELGDTSVLTVSDLPQFARRGGMIQFILDGNRVRFEINLAPAARAGLTLSSELLKLATNVRRSTGD